MPQQFVQSGNQDPNYGQLLAMTQDQAKRQDDRQKRKAAQAALMQQMVDRGEIQVEENGDIKMGREGMNFSSPEARKRYQNSLRPENAGNDLSRDIAATTTTTLEKSAEQIMAEGGQAAVNAVLTPEQKRLNQTAARMADAIDAQYLDNETARMKKRAEDRGDRTAPPAGTPVDAEQSRADAQANMQAGMAEAEAARANGAGTSTSTTTEDGATTQTDKQPDVRSSGSNSQSGGNSIATRDELHAKMSGPEANFKVSDRLRTKTDTGMQFRDEIKESLPSLRRAAAIESISAMFGGAGQKGHGQYEALAQQRERDLATFNERLAKRSVTDVISGGMTEADVKAGTTDVWAKDALSGSTNMSITNKLSGGTFSGGGGGDRGNERNMIDANGNNVSLNFGQDGSLLQDASNLSVYTPTGTIKEGNDLYKMVADTRIKNNTKYKDWNPKITQYTLDDKGKKQPAEIILSRPDGKKIYLRYDTNLRGGGKQGENLGLSHWGASADAGITEAELAHFLGNSASNSSQAGRHGAK